MKIQTKEIFLPRFQQELSQPCNYYKNTFNKNYHKKEYCTFWLAVTAAVEAAIDRRRKFGFGALPVERRLWNWPLNTCQRNRNTWYYLTQKKKHSEKIHYSFLTMSTIDTLVETPKHYNKFGGAFKMYWCRIDHRFCFCTCDSSTSERVVAQARGLSSGTRNTFSITNN
jgi:hypothetical protein